MAIENIYQMFTRLGAAGFLVKTGQPVESAHRRASDHGRFA